MVAIDSLSRFLLYKNYSLKKKSRNSLQKIAKFDKLVGLFTFWL